MSLDETRRFWDQQASTYDDERDHGLLDPHTRSAWQQLLVKVIGSHPARIADLGSGTGTLAVLLAALGHRVTGLERQRRTFAWKCGGLDTAGLSKPHPPTTMTLSGLLKHMALVEDDWFSVKLLGRAPSPPWNAVDWRADPNWEWRTAAEDSPEQLFALWQEGVARSRSNLARVLADGDLGQVARFTWPDGRSPSVRRMLVDMIEEYARHTGHADLLREAVDGLTGEDPPRP